MDSSRLLAAFLFPGSACLAAWAVELRAALRLANGDKKAIGEWAEQ